MAAKKIHSSQQDQQQSPMRETQESPLGPEPGLMELPQMIPAITLSHPGLSKSDDMLLSTIYNRIHKANGLSGDTDSLLGHINRTTALTAELAKRLRLNPKDMETLVLAASLHDIGKLENSTVWDTVNSPERYPQEDFARRKIIDEHASHSVAIIKRSGLDVSDEVLKLVEHHHYPERLGDGKLRMMGEILYWVDHTDAILDKRSYKEPEKTLTSLECTLQQESTNSFTLRTCIRSEVYMELTQLIQTQAFKNIYPNIKP